MLFTVDSKLSLAEIQRRLEESAVAHQFGILTVHNLAETMRKKSVELGWECSIFEVCNPVAAKRVLDAHPAVSTALPCRISVYGREGSYTLATLLPTALMESFGVPALAAVAADVEAVLKAMMVDAAG
jgi:uncharacterized protein (DUF302 family)